MKETLPKELKGKKVSEVFKEYVEPYLNSCLRGKSDPDINIKELENVLRIPWIVWNALVLMAHSKDNTDYMAHLNSLIEDKPIEVKNLIKYLQERKQQLFNQYDYLFGKFDVTIDKENNTIKYSVEARKVPNPS